MTDQSLFYQYSVKFYKKTCNSIMKFLDDKKLLRKAQFGCRPSGSCECQFISIIHDIYTTLDCNPSLEVRGRCLDIY